MIVIFDNLLILAHDYQDAYEKLEIVLLKCKERNIYLKLSKCKFGVTEANFFGYIVNGDGYHLSEERKISILNMPFPEPPQQTKKLQRFLGSIIYFKPFVPLFSNKTGRLNEMTKKSFNWNESTWQHNYRKVFEELKHDIVQAQTLYHPDYSLEWILSVDASDFAVGGVLFQIPRDAKTETDFQVIAFISKKLSEVAQRWSVMEKECFSIFYSVKKLSYYLYGKFFTIRTDHQNLLWMELSEVPKIIRMRIYLQSFNFTLKHVKGKDNCFADWLSRVEVPDVPALIAMTHVNNVKGEEVDCFESNGVVEDVVDDLDMPRNPQQMLELVHNSRIGHVGARRTWLRLNKIFPGHKVPIHFVEDWVSECRWCQKLRLDMTDSLPAPIRKLEPEHSRHYCGFDTLYVTPASKDGYSYINVVKLLPSGLVGLYPVKTLSAEGVALSLFQFFITYGVVDVLITDPGSNINAEVVKTLLKWFGVKLRMSLTNRHQSNLVERSHRETLRFLTAMVQDQRMVKNWSDHTVIGMVQFILNNEVSKGIGISPFQYVFGNNDLPYLRVPSLMTDGFQANQFVKRLDVQLQEIRDVAKKVQEKEQQGRWKADPDAGLNQYCVGDFVLKRVDPGKFKQFKLQPNFSGPFEVVEVYKADISVKNLITGGIVTYHMDDLKPFFGSAKEAFELAMRDNDQHEVDVILSYRGDPLKRTTTEFLVRFADGDERWLPFGKDISSTVQFESFCNTRTQLIPLLTTEKEWKVRMKRINNEGFDGVSPGVVFYLELRYFGDSYYQHIGLPYADAIVYVVECEYVEWLSKKETVIVVKCKLFKQEYHFNAVIVFLYGRNFELNGKMKLVDEEFAKEFPKVFDG